MGCRGAIEKLANCSDLAEIGWIGDHINYQPNQETFKRKTGILVLIVPGQ